MKFYQTEFNTECNILISTKNINLQPYLVYQKKLETFYQTYIDRSFVTSAKKYVISTGAKYRQYVDGGKTNF